MRERHFLGPCKVAKLPTISVGFCRLRLSNSPFVTKRVMILQSAQEWYYYHLRQRAGLAQDLEALSSLSQLSAIRRGGNHDALKWSGMPASRILPTLVCMLFHDSAL